MVSGTGALLPDEQRQQAMRSLLNASTHDKQCSFTSLANDKLVTIIVGFCLVTIRQSC